MKVTLSNKDKKVVPVIAIIVAIVVFIMNRMYVKITDIAYVSSQGVMEPYEIEIKCGFIFPERIQMLVTTGEIVKTKNHSFQFKGRDLYKNGEKVITLKTDDQYQQTKTTPLVRI